MEVLTFLDNITQHAQELSFAGVSLIVFAILFYVLRLISSMTENFSKTLSERSKEQTEELKLHADSQRSLFVALASQTDRFGEITSSLAMTNTGLLKLAGNIEQSAIISQAVLQRADTLILDVNDIKKSLKTGYFTRNPLGVMVINAAGVVISSNKALIEYLGYEGGSLILRNALEPGLFLSIKDGVGNIAATLEILKTTLANKTNISNTILSIYNPKLNQHVWFLIDTVVNFSAVGDVLYVAVLFTPIDELLAHPGDTPS